MTTSAERMKEFRQRFKDQGCRQREIWIPPEFFPLMERLTEQLRRHEPSVDELIEVVTRHYPQNT